MWPLKLLTSGLPSVRGIWFEKKKKKRFETWTFWYQIFVKCTRNQWKQKHTKTDFLFWQKLSTFLKKKITVYAQNFENILSKSFKSDRFGTFWKKSKTYHLVGFVEQGVVVDGNLFHGVQRVVHAVHLFFYLNYFKIWTKTYGFGLSFDEVFDFRTTF